MPIKFTIVASPASDQMNQIGPKTIGGHGWKSDPQYKQAMKDWNGSQDLLMAPCPFFAFIGVAKKVEEFTDPKAASDFWTAQ